MVNIIKKKVTPDFSGTIKGKATKGSNDVVELIYEKGKIVSSVVKDKDGKEVLSKTFELLEDGSKKITTKKAVCLIFIIHHPIKLYSYYSTTSVECKL